MSPRDRITALLWDVWWHGDGYGKHGNGPFVSQAQAEACLRAIGWPGTVELVAVTMDRRHLEQLKTPKGSSSRPAEEANP